MKLRWIILLAVLLVGALVALLGPLGFGGKPGDPVDRTGTDDEAPPLKKEDAPASPLADSDEPTLAGEGGRLAGTPAATGETPPPESSAAEVVARYEGEVPAGWHEAPPAQRPHAIRPPRPRGPSVRPGGSSGGVGPTGHWSRFPPPLPPKGDATIRVVVANEAGAPIAGADVYLAPRESLGREAVSFGDLRTIGTTNAEGSLTAVDLPAGAATLAANVAGLLNGPRGLDARSSIPVLLVSRATVSAHLRLPLDEGGFGRVTGRVTDGEGRPIARAEIRTGYVRVYADADGRFEAPHLAAGGRTLTARRNGYATGTLDVDVPAGGTRDVEIVLGWAESGDLHLEGLVLTAEGRGLEGATVYLIDETGRGTLRSVQTDADGHYRFEALPDRLRGIALRIQAGKFREGYSSANVHLEDGIVDPHLDVTLPPRQVKVRFALTDAGTGAPVDRCRIDVERLDDPDAPARGFTGRRADGVYEHYYDAGRYRFSVQAPDRETQTREVTLAPSGDDVEVPVAFAGRGDASVPVTLRVTVRDLVTEEPVTACSIVVLDEAGEEVARFVGRAPDGVYSLPAPSGPRTLRVNADGYEPTEEAVALPADSPETEITIHLRPR